MLPDLFYNIADHDAFRCDHLHSVLINIKCCIRRFLGHIERVFSAEERTVFPILNSEIQVREFILVKLRQLNIRSFSRTASCRQNCDTFPNLSVEFPGLSGVFVRERNRML